MASQQVPIIDIGDWFTGDSNARFVLAKRIGDAARDVGFFTVVNHGIDWALVEDAFATSKEYFDLPLVQKQKVCMRPDYPYGYENNETLASSQGNGTGFKDLKETFSVNTYYPEVCWPDQPPNLQPVLTTYSNACEMLASSIMGMFAISLGLNEDYFQDLLRNPSAALRTLNYPHQHTKPIQGQLRASAHSDYGALTILAAFQSPGGLQVQNIDGTWQDVVPPMNSFIINLGDLMSRWTNDKWKSTVHRVVNPIVQGNNRRQSIAYFYTPNENAIIECIETCVGADEFKKYPPVFAGEYLFSKHSKAMSG